MESGVRSRDLEVRSNHRWRFLCGNRSYHCHCFYRRRREKDCVQLGKAVITGCTSGVVLHISYVPCLLLHLIIHLKKERKNVRHLISIHDGVKIGCVCVLFPILENSRKEEGENSGRSSLSRIFLLPPVSSTWAKSCQLQEDQPLYWSYSLSHQI